MNATLAQHWWTIVLRGVIAVLFGIFGPRFGYMFSHGRWWLAFGGVVSLIWGVMLVAAPLIGAVVLAWWLGIYAIVFGISLLACGWQLRAQRTV
jgi:uncharacterized membrane protein HdeD (DUF308 family)